MKPQFLRTAPLSHRLVQVFLVLTGSIRFKVSGFCDTAGKNTPLCPGDSERLAAALIESLGSSGFGSYGEFCQVCRFFSGALRDEHLLTEDLRIESE